jgi:hypothetical protein
MWAPDWQVIGLHDVGGEYVRKLNGQSGTHAASEAIWIQSVAKALADFFRSPVLHWGSMFPRLPCKLGIGTSGRRWLIISTVSPKYVLFFGNDALDGFHERQVSLLLGQSSVRTGAVRIQATLALHPL